MFKIGFSVHLFVLGKEDFYANKGCIYLIKIHYKHSYCEILLEFKIAVFYCNIF